MKKSHLLSFCIATMLSFTGASANPFSKAPTYLGQQCSWFQYAPDYIHQMTARPNAHLIAIEDGSQWEVHRKDVCVLNTWGHGDPLVISPNHSWFSSSEFYITNQSNYTYVRANLVISPHVYGANSHWIVGIDHHNDCVYLENGTTWRINPSDGLDLMQWGVNDHIIIGYYDGGWCSAYDRILINWNMESYTRARQY